MTKEQLEALEKFIEAVVRDMNSDWVGDTIYRNDWRDEVLKAFNNEQTKD